MKKTVKESTITEGVLDDIDDDGFMAKRQLYDVAKCAVYLHKMILDTDDLEPWVQAKITTALDYMKTVKEYLEYAGADAGAPGDMGQDIAAVVEPMGDMSAEPEATMATGPAVPLNASTEMRADQPGEITKDMVMRMAYQRKVIDDDQFLDSSESLDYIAQAVADFYSPMEDMGSSDVTAIVRHFVGDAMDGNIDLGGERAEAYGYRATVRESKIDLKAHEIYNKMIKDLKG